MREYSDRRRIKADPNARSPAWRSRSSTTRYGTLTFVRVYSGTLKSGDMVLNTTKDHRERIGRMFQMHADKRAEIKEVHAGDIAAFVGAEGHPGHGRDVASRQSTRWCWSVWPSPRCR